MTSAEIRLEMQNELNQLPENVLPEVSAVLQRLKIESTDESRRQKFFEQILQEDGELLRRLGQYDIEL